MMAAPRFCTVVRKSPCSQATSSMTSAAGLPPMRALAKSGNWVAEWFPQMATLVTVDTGTPALLGQLAPWPGSRRAGSWRTSGRPGTSGALDRAIRQLVLQGLPTTSTRTSEAALAAMARPWGPKIPPLTVSRSPRSMPALRGIEPTSSAHEVPSKAVFEVGGGDDVADQGKGAVVDLHDHALERLHARLDLEQAQHHRLVGAEQLARGDAEQEGVADLAGGPGDGDVDGRVGCHGAEANRRRSTGSNQRRRRPCGDGSGPMV